MKHIWFTVLISLVLISAVQQSNSVALIFFSIRVYHTILNIVPCVYSRTLLFIHPLYKSLHLLIPDSQSIPPLPLSPSAITSLFSLSHNFQFKWLKLPNFTERWRFLSKTPSQCDVAEIEMEVLALYSVSSCVSRGKRVKTRAVLPGEGLFSGLLCWPVLSCRAVPPAFTRRFT